MQFRPTVFASVCGLGASQLVSCGEASPPASRLPRPAPSVVAVARYYAGHMARGTRFSAPASRVFADSVASLNSNNSLTISLGTCEVQGWVDSLQRLTSVHIMAPYAQYQQWREVNRARPCPYLLVRLGALRRAFGPGSIEQDPPLTKLEGSRCYPVLFDYQPVPSHQVQLYACLPTADYGDSVRVNTLSLYPR
jgi:hypothetical protein